MAAEAEAAARAAKASLYLRPGGWNVSCQGHERQERQSELRRNQQPQRDRQLQRDREPQRDREQQRDRVPMDSTLETGKDGRQV